MRKFLFSALAISALLSAPVAISAVATPQTQSQALFIEVEVPSTLHIMQATPAASDPIVEDDLAPPSWNPSDWFKDAAALGAFVAFLVAFLKKNVFKNAHGLAVVAISFATSILIALLGTFDLPVFGRLNPLNGMEAVMFGVQAAIIASGGWDLIKGLLAAVFGGKSQSAEAPE